MAASIHPPCSFYRDPWVLADLPRTTPVLLAFSGGADSCALLDLLADAAKRDGFPLIAAHVNHGIRGEDAIADREFCMTTAKKYGVELCVLNADVPALAKQSGRGLEEEARAVRYAFFEELMRARAIPLLVTAHHADDHLETLLFRICRGSGLHGLGGIAPVREIAGGRLVRPLLGATKQELLDYCRERGLAFVTDRTNADTHYARNRIRAEVTPVLESLFEGVAARTVQMSAELREDEAYLLGLATDFLASEQTPHGIPTKALAALPVPICKRVLRVWVKEGCGRDAERVHIDALMALLAEEPTNAAVTLPEGNRALCEMGMLRLLPRAQTRDALPLAFCEGTWQLLGGEMRLTVQKEENGRKVHNLSTQSCINRDVFSVIIKDSLYWRTRCEGDLLLKGGMHRKLRKLYNAAKIPVRLRDALPVLCDDTGIVWAPFAGYRDGLENEDGERYTVLVEI